MRARSIKISVWLAAGFLARAQSPADTPDPIQSAVATTTSPAISDDRILGIIPNFQTVSDPTVPYTPLRIRDKWILFVKETVDPYAFGSAAAGAAISQWHNEDPRYGTGGWAYAQRFGAAQADLTTQNLFGDAVFASLFHEDPRYFREGPSKPVMHRIFYAMSRVVITRTDSGGNTFNFSGILGMGAGIGLSNAYYPPKSVNGGEMGYRVFSSLTSAALGNLLPEFWPDIRQKIARHRQRN